MKTHTPLRVPIGQRQLFLDNHAVATVRSLKRTMHTPTKKGAVIRVDYLAHPDSTIQIRTAPVWNPERERYQLWANGVGERNGYYESRDGLAWQRGRRMNMHVSMAVRDERDPDGDRRYKAALLSQGFAASPDGIRWKALDVPAIPSADEGNFSYDSGHGLFIHTVKRNGTPPRNRDLWVRAVALATSRDFRTWRDHGLVFEADAEDQRLGRRNIRARFADRTLQHPRHHHPEAYFVDVYNMGVFHYEGMYVGMPAVYHATGNVPNYPNTDGFQIVQLTCSRDLKKWQRLGDRQAFIGPSRLGSGAYDMSQILPPSAPVVRGDELWFYYTGIKYRSTWKYVGTFPNGEHIPLPGFDPDQGAVCLAVLRRDGFISLDAGRAGGTVRTKPLRWRGRKLCVNANALKGELTVEALGEKNEVLAASHPLGSDEPRGQIEWRTGSVAALRGRTVSLRFRLRNARFYAWWLEA